MRRRSNTSYATTHRRSAAFLARCAAVALLSLGTVPTGVTAQRVASCPSAVFDSASSSLVVVLGVGTPNLTPERSGTSVGIIVRGTLYIFDAGPGVERRLFELCARPSARFRRYGPVFITHLHSDHTLGLPGLLYHAHNPGEPFRVIGPPGIRSMMEHIVAAWSEDRTIRMGARQLTDSTRWETDVREITRGVVWQDANVTVTAIEVQHGAWTYALGYHVQTPDRRIVISGDTRPSEAIVEACSGCDILIHEMTPIRNTGSYAREYHTSAQQLGELAARAKPRQLVVYHSIWAPEAMDDVVAALRAIGASYTGPIVFARDFDIY
jgi:ribonuclease BN (tRNA processing enzyme)